MHTTPPRHAAVIGAGIAGLACARTLAQAGWQVTLLDKGRQVGGRMSTRLTPFGSFDHGAQYFTVRDPRFGQAIATAPAGTCRPWSASAVRVLDAHGAMLEAGLPNTEPHWVPSPGMNALAVAWAQPLRAAGRLHLATRVDRIEHDPLRPEGWQVRASLGDGRPLPDDVAGAPAEPPGTAVAGQSAQRVIGGFDAVLLALPAAQAAQLLRQSAVAPSYAQRLEGVLVQPCWTLMLAYPQASQPGLAHLGPQWNAARSTHHRIAWLARESSKPGRGPVERWTVQASAAWSAEHLEDDPQRVSAKLMRAFAEVTGIHAEPALAQAHRWRYARTQHPLGLPFLWDAKAGLGVCGDWCLGHRVEDGFVSGLELALAVAA